VSLNGRIGLSQMWLDFLKGPDSEPANATAGTKIWYILRKTKVQIGKQMFLEMAAYLMCVHDMHVVAHINQQQAESVKQQLT